MNTALVTGADGFIGSYLLRFLHQKGWKVVGGYRHHNSLPRLQGNNGELVQCDLSNGQRVEQLVRDLQPKYIFHLGAQSLPTISWVDPVQTFESNIMGSLYLFEAVRKMKRPSIVVSACSSAAYGPVPAAAVPVRESQPMNPIHPYGISKLCLDLLARQYHSDYGIPAVNIRLFNTTGPGKTNDAPSDFAQRIIRIKKGLIPPVIEVGNLKPQRAFLDVNDTVRGFYLAAMKGRAGEAYNLCAARTYQIGDLLRMSIKIAGVKAEIREAAHLMRPSDERIIFGSTQKIRKDTGWKPERSLEDTLGSMLQYWEANIPAAPGNTGS